MTGCSTCIAVGVSPFFFVQQQVMAPAAIASVYLIVLLQRVIVLEVGYRGRKNIPSVENPEFTKTFSPLKPRGQNMAMHASTTGRNFFFGSKFYLQVH